MVRLSARVTASQAGGLTWTSHLPALLRGRGQAWGGSPDPQGLRLGRVVGSGHANLQPQQRSGRKSPVSNTDAPCGRDLR